MFVILSLIISCTGQGNQKKNDANSITINPDIGETKFPLPENGFYCGLLDSKGNLWFGSRGNGVFKLEGNSYLNYTKSVFGNLIHYKK